jgi:hypothetical protein
MPILNGPFPEPVPRPLPKPIPEPFPFPLPFPRPFPKPFPLPKPFPYPWFEECTPKILVVTDNLNYDPTGDFGLTEFVDTLRANTIHGMTPIVTTARFNPSPAAVLSFDAASRHITNFKFKDATHGVAKSRYDVVFLLAINGQFSSQKLVDEPGALEAVSAFMQAGGGLFSTGDHDDLGAGMCMSIPRVRNMRNWTDTPPLQDVPSAGGVDRLTTNLPGRGDIAGSDDTYQFGDQSDQFPQRLYANYRTEAGGVGFGHPLLQLPASARVVEVFPDHPHEGECRVPVDLTTKMADGVTDEWPLGGGVRVSPEMVAITVSHGNAFPGKAAVTPRSFMAICAYDGHRADVGRVVTDATWHHFVNINIKPGMSALAGRDLTDIKQYYGNLAVWLMPKNVRVCRRFPWLLAELMAYPLFEELSPIPVRPDGQMLHEIGTVVATALLDRYTHAEVQSLIDDALEEAIGADAKSKLGKFGREGGGLSAHDAGLAAIGAFTVAIAERFNEIRDKGDLDGEKAFSDVGRKAAANGVKLYLVHARKDHGKLGDLVDSMAP